MIKQWLPSSRHRSLNYAFDLVGNPTSWKGTAQTFNSANQNTQNHTLTFDGNGTAINIMEPQVIVLTVQASSSYNGN